jgi:hypothetical protein
MIFDPLNEQDIVRNVGQAPLSQNVLRQDDVLNQACAKFFRPLFTSRAQDISSALTSSIL